MCACCGCRQFVACRQLLSTYPKWALLIWMTSENNTSQRPPAREIQGLPLALRLFVEGFCALIQNILFKILIPWSLSTLLEIYESVLESGGICKRFLVCRVFLSAVWGWDMMLLKARKQHKTKETLFRVEIAVLRLNRWSHLTVHLFFHFILVTIYIPWFSLPWEAWVCWNLGQEENKISLQQNPDTKKRSQTLESQDTNMADSGCRDPVEGETSPHSAKYEQ